MLYIDRINSIKQILLQQESVSVADLSTTFNVSTETIRRDLDRLSQDDDRVIRVHGGAFYRSSVKETPYSYRQTALIEEKNIIAQLAFPYVQNGDSLMMDCSTTTLNLAKLLKATDLKLSIITNSLSIIEELSDCDHIKLVCIGGNYQASARAFVGSQALSSLQNYHADSSFISCSGISQEFGITDVNEDISILRRIMITNSSSHNLLVDHTKFGRCKTSRIAPLENLDYIFTDEELTPQWQDTLAKKHIRFKFC